MILDIADPARPQFVSNLNWGPRESGATHTALPLPGRDLVVVADESIVPGRGDIVKQVRVVDVADPYSPVVLSSLPLPGGAFWDAGRAVLARTTSPTRDRAPAGTPTGCS